eukprot:TRINITY_DN70134_c0_g1_i1.p1 TRINITY_DN70134_c0_g1~~TRINITY_DN70134_c0_g1_i1.p1  ORF type:complete len:309 (+),score=34.80 TRINITY_DN70134_c0_g1_i1:69-995(+)
MRSVLPTLRRRPSRPCDWVYPGRITQFRCNAAGSQAMADLTAPVPLADYTVLSKRATGRNSSILRFALPRESASLGWRGVKLGLDVQSAAESAPLLQSKSYSPVSLPSDTSFFDLLVKPYPPRDGGGFGAFLCGLEPGDTAPLLVKAPRLIHGSAEVSQRWSRVGLVAAGTGLAPLLQIALALLNDPQDTTLVSLLFVNRFEDDILMRDELEALQASSSRFTVTFSLTQPSAGWTGATCSGSAALAESALPAPSASTMVLVCGTDGFVDMWAGPTKRIQDGGKKKKLQGSVAGILKTRGFDESMVYKY